MLGQQTKSVAKFVKAAHPDFTNAVSVPSTQRLGNNDPDFMRSDIFRRQLLHPPPPPNIAFKLRIFWMIFRISRFRERILYELDQMLEPRRRTEEVVYDLDSLIKYSVSEPLNNDDQLR